ncbi:MAG: 1,2-phenylacetyl-CoA epoxidase subunit PaaE [Gammaproteobacteria bacterium]
MPRIAGLIADGCSHVMSEFFPLRIADVREETDNAVCISFDVPPELRERFRFTQGQYLTLNLDIDGTETRRSYSICSGVDDEELRIAVKKINGGLFSTFVNSRLSPGDTIEVMPPQGRFFTELDERNDKNYLCIAAGSGITPVLSIIKSILAREPNSHVTLLFGNQRVSTIMFREELEALKNRYMARFQWLNILSREKQEVEILNGRINNRKGAELCRQLLDLHRMDEFFLCGPEAMISEVSRGLRSSGIDESRIHYELFTGSADDAAAVIAKHHERAINMAGRMCSVTVIAGGRETVFELSADGENILDGGLDNGVDLPFACKGGVCATCKAKLISGEVDMDLNHALQPDELAAGYILTCQAHPVSDRVIVDYDR